MANMCDSGTGKAQRAKKKKKRFFKELNPQIHRSLSSRFFLVLFLENEAFIYAQCRYHFHFYASTCSLQTKLIVRADYEALKGIIKERPGRLETQMGCSSFGSERVGIRL